MGLDQTGPEIMGYQSGSSNTVTPGRDSPDVSLSRPVLSTASPKQQMEQYSTLGQLSYAPATQTTVVTTTTTTTTSFPPLLFKAPRHLHDRDPRQYPLASSPTPSSIRRFRFMFDGKPTCFSEANDVDSSMLEAKEKYSKLESGNGMVTSIVKSETRYDNNASDLKELGSPDGGSAAPHKPNVLNASRKRVGSPVSLAEAAEIASLQRRSKRSRLGVTSAAEVDEFTVKKMEDSASLQEQQQGPLGCDTPATPDTDAGSIGNFRSGRLTRASRLRAKAAAASRSDGLLPPKKTNKSSNSPGRSSRNVSPLPSSLDGAAASSSFGADEIPSSATNPMPYMSATPPMADTDLEPVDSFAATVGNTPQNRLTNVDTNTIPDASLPSPLLSPVTAAASLADPLADREHTTTSNETDEHEDSKPTLALDRLASLTKKLDIPSALAHDDATANPQLPTPTLMDIPLMLDSFDAMPSELQTYVMFQLLRRCNKPTLHFVADVVNPALKCDYLAQLPLELSLNIVKFLDAKSMCRAAQVSKKWRQIIDSDDKSWRDLLQRDGFVLPEGEVIRAEKEGWAYQGIESYERDLRTEMQPKSDTEEYTPQHTPAARADGDLLESPTINRGLKRKSNSRFISNKRRKLRLTRNSDQSPSWSRTPEQSRTVVIDDSALDSASPISETGLKSLRNRHLFKSIYRRHHGIRKSWMEPNTEPYHLAFRAHGRHVVTCLQFDADKILTGSDDTKIHVYSTKTGALRSVLDGHEGGVWALQYEGNTLVSGSTDRTVRVWDIKAGRCLHVFQGHTSTVRCLVILKPTVIGENPDGSPIIMPKEPLIITGSRDSTLRIWKLPQPGDDSVYQSGPAVNEEDNPYFIRVLTGHIHSVRAIAAHGDTLVSGSYDSTVRVWRISTGDVVHRLTGHTAKVYSVILDNERNRCISGSMDNLVKVWSLDTGACIFTLEGHSSLVGLLDLSHGRLVSAAADSTLRIWDPETGQCKSTLSAHTGAITCFQHDGQKVISGSDRTLKMWDVKTGECVRDLLTHLSGVWQVKFNERKCVAAVQRNNWTYIEVLDFGASRDMSRDGGQSSEFPSRVVVDCYGQRVDDLTDTEEGRS